MVQLSVNANIADYIDMMSDFSSGTGFRRLAENHWRPVLKAQFSGRGFD